MEIGQQIGLTLLALLMGLALYNDILRLVSN
jgi:membrane-associated protease RseP (regulator of RpoE activity)